MKVSTGRRRAILASLADFGGVFWGLGDTMPVWGARNLLNGFSKRIGQVIAMPRKELILRDIIES